MELEVIIAIINTKIKINTTAFESQRNHFKWMHVTALRGVAGFALVRLQQT